MFNALNISKEWNIPQKHRIDACFNHGDHDHGIPKCPKPINQSRIDRAKSKFSRSGGGRGQCSGCGGCDGQDGRGNGHGSGHGHGDGDKTNSCGKWKSNAKAVNAVTTSGGVRKCKGKWIMMCKPCGWNTTHTTGFHDSYVKDPASFSLPATHLFWIKSSKNPSEKGRGDSASTVAIPPVASAASLLRSQMGPLIAQYQTRSNDSKFSSFLADFQRALN
jgi:hypothetical protein